MSNIEHYQYYYILKRSESESSYMKFDSAANLSFQYYSYNIHIVIK